jgi:O-antigen/teichoic acid export membrane protein
MTAPVGSPSLRANFGWLLAERGWRVVVGFAVSVLITRYLGPEDFGLLSYAFSVCAILGSIVGLGIDDVLARELVRQPDQSRTLMLAGLRIKAVSALTAFGLSLVVTCVLRPDDWHALGLVIWVASGLIFLPADVVELWFQSRERMRAPALVRQGALGLAALVRVGLVVSSAPVWSFAAATALEAGFIAAGFGLLWLKRAKSAETKSNAIDSRALTMRLIREGGPLLLSGFLVVLTMQGDRLLLIRLADEKAAGFYAAAARMTELMYVIPVALGAAFLPRLSGLHGSDPSAYALLARKAGGILVAVTLVIATGVSVLAPYFVPLLLGDAYHATANVWAIHVWILVFVAIVSLRSRLWVVEGHTGWILAISGVTAVLNLIGNCWLIPRFGAVGAAWSGVLAWACSALVWPWCASGPARSMRRWCGLANAR